MKHLLCWLGLCWWLSAFSLSAQQFPGLSVSNYGGLFRVNQNPSTLGGTPYKYQVKAATLGSSLNNRYFIFFGSSALLYPLKTPHTSSELYGQSRTMGSLSSADLIHLQSELRLPSVLFSIGKWQGVAFQLRSRGFVQGRGIPRPIRQAYFKRLDRPFEGERQQDWGNFSLMQQSFSEASASYGLQLLDLKAHKLRIGGTVKYLFGARVNYLEGTAQQVNVLETAPETNELLVTRLRYQAAYSAPLHPLRVGQLFQADRYGSGWGYDLGASYELGKYWKNGTDPRPSYLLRLSASVLDRGAIRYQTTQGLSQSGQLATLRINQTMLEAIGDRGAAGWMESVPAAPRTADWQAQAQLPTVMQLEADVQLIKSFFLNVAQTKPLPHPSPLPQDLSYPGTLTVTPRFEDEDSDFALPLTYFEGQREIAVGAVARFGPLAVGFNNFRGLLSRKATTRASYMYISLTLWRLKSHDALRTD